jgi:CheY-like chemotaxis protein
MTERGPAQVLLVEDNSADVRLFREALSRHASDVQLHVVENGVDALQFVRREGTFRSAIAADLIILDFNLPRKDGPAPRSLFSRQRAGRKTSYGRTRITRTAISANRSTWKSSSGR